MTTLPFPAHPLLNLCHLLFAESLLAQLAYFAAPNGVTLDADSSARHICASVTAVCCMFAAARPDLSERELAARVLESLRFSAADHAAHTAKGSCSDPETSARLARNYATAVAAKVEVVHLSPSGPRAICGARINVPGEAEHWTRRARDYRKIVSPCPSCVERLDGGPRGVARVTAGASS